MEYGQVVTLLFVALLGYYVFLIVTDLQKAKAAQMAEQENHIVNNNMKVYQKII